ncbi:DDB1- and CUL4-associated factor 8-like isoform X2 [Babylonia areolata]|uniref:DDB1- and CUL4-associated factor 8-like isoform X2 n=1 Tax=Babylonia areolata TaxID=304850 RepID=UPI003FD318A0
MAEAAVLPDSAGLESEDVESGGNGNIGDGTTSPKQTMSAGGEDARLPDSSSSEGDVGGGGRKLQKNDSGIDVEKSPSASTKDGLSDVDCGDSVSECFVDSTGFSLSHSESVKSEDSPSQPEDDVDASFSDNNLDSTDISPNETSAAADFQANSSVNMETADGVSSSDACASGPEGGSHLDEEEEDDDDDEDDAVVDSASAKRKRRHALLSSSECSDEDHDDLEDDAAMETGDKSEEEEASEVKEGPKPKHKWRAIQDLRQREIGSSNCTPPSMFREKVQGSLQMVQRLTLQYKMEYHEGCVNALHFNREGTLLASGSDDLHIVLWNWIRNRRALIYDSGHRSNVFQAKFMPFSGDCHVVSCARDGQVRLAELSLTGVCKSTKKLAQHRGAAHKLALEYDSPHVFLSCGEDALTYEIDLREDKPHKLVVTKENDMKVALYSIHSNPVNPFEFCTGGRDHYIRVYDKRKINENVNGGIVRKYCPQHLESSSAKANVTCACYNYNGTEILGSYNDEDIYLFDNSHSDGASAIHRYIGHRNNATVKGVSFYGPRSEYVVSGSDCGHVFLWEKETEEVVQFMKADECGVVNVLEPHPFAPVLATSGLDHDVKIWAPTAHDPSKLDGLVTQKRKNRREREKERYHEPEMIDGQMLWFIMHHFRRSARRREGEEVSSSSDNSESSEDDGGQDGAAGDRMQCQTS